MVKPQRLQKYIASCGICSRRKAEDLIESGQVMVNGQKAHLGMKVTTSDTVKINDHIVSATNQFETYLVYKPRGVTSTVADKFAERLITELVPSTSRIFPVGRLDKESEGLIILTNDGELAHQLSHPRYQIKKTYRVTINRTISNEDITTLTHGIEDQGEYLSIDSIRISSAKIVTITLHHGKKRHIRRMLASLDYQVLELIRTDIGGLSLATLGNAPYLALTKNQIDQLLFSCHKPLS